MKNIYSKYLWIPMIQEFRQDIKSATDYELFAQIFSLDSKSLKINFKNKQFAENFGKSLKAIRDSLNKLQKKGYIYKEFSNGKRIIKVNQNKIKEVLGENYFEQNKVYHIPIIHKLRQYLASAVDYELLAHILSFNGRGAPCYFSNETISKRFGKSTRAVANTISSLVKKGFITVEYINGKRNLVANLNKIDEILKLNITKEKTGGRKLQVGGKFSSSKGGKKTSLYNIENNNINRKEKEIKILLPNLEEVKKVFTKLCYTYDIDVGIIAEAFYKKHIVKLKNPEWKILTERYWSIWRERDINIKKLSADEIKTKSEIRYITNIYKKYKKYTGLVKYNGIEYNFVDGLYNYTGNNGYMCTYLLNNFIVSALKVPQEHKLEINGKIINKNNKNETKGGDCKNLDINKANSNERKKMAS